MLKDSVRFPKYFNIQVNYSETDGCSMLGFNIRIIARNMNCLICSCGPHSNFSKLKLLFARSTATRFWIESKKANRILEIIKRLLQSIWTYMLLLRIKCETNLILWITGAMCRLSPGDLLKRAWLLGQPIISFFQILSVEILIVHYPFLFPSPTYRSQTHSLLIVVPCIFGHEQVGHPWRQWRSHWYSFDYKTKL